MHQWGWAIIGMCIICLMVDVRWVCANQQRVSAFLLVIEYQEETHLWAIFELKFDAKIFVA